MVEGNNYPVRSLQCGRLYPMLLLSVLETAICFPLHTMHLVRYVVSIRIWAHLYVRRPLLCLDNSMCFMQAGRSLTVSCKQRLLRLTGTLHLRSIDLLQSLSAHPLLANLRPRWDS